MKKLAAISALAFTLPQMVSAQIQCTPPEQLICWGSYQCVCNTVQVIELDNERMLFLHGLSEKKPIRVDAALSKHLDEKVKR